MSHYVSIRNIKRKFITKLLHISIRIYNERICKYNSTISLLSIVHWMFFLFISPAIYTDLYLIKYIYSVFKKVRHQTHGGITLSNLFLKIKILSLADSAVHFQQTDYQKIPPHLNRADTLPCEICLQEIAMPKNCVNNITATQNSNSHSRFIHWKL